MFVNGFFFQHYGFRGGLFAGGFAGRAVWQHDPSHRLGVSYPNGQLAGRYQGRVAGFAERDGKIGQLQFGPLGRRGKLEPVWIRDTSAYGNRSVTQGARSTAPQSAGRATEGQWQHFQGAQHQLRHSDIRLRRN